MSVKKEPKVKSQERNSNRSGKLIKDVGIYAIGNLGSRLIPFLLVPLYTFYIRPAEYGFYDICFTAVLILMPFLSLQLRDGGFRFLVDANSEDRKKAVVTFVYKTLFRNSIVAIIIGVVVSLLYSFEYLWLLIALLISMSIYEVIIQVIRGLGYTKYFVVSGIISSLLIGGLSIFFIVVMDLGITGIFYGNILARFLTIIILEFRLKILQRYFFVKLSNSLINKEILRYCMPLLPGAICWWLVGSSNKFFIEHYLGLGENGLYAIALKFTAILETVAYVFYQAWQETALRQYESPDRDKFFSGIMNNYLFFLISGVIVFSFALKINYFWLVNIDYQQSVNYIFLLAISAMFFSLSSFFDMGYQCSKKTIYTLPGIILASLVNMVGNYFLIKNFGVYGIVCSSIITFATLFIYRIFDTRRFFRISYSKQIIAPIIILIISGFIFHFSNTLIVDIIYLLIVIITLSIIAPSEIKNYILSKLHGH